MNNFNRFSTIDFRNPRTIISLIIMAIVVVALSFSATYFYVNSTSVTVPDFSAANIFEVQQWIDDNHLNSDQVEISKTYNEEIAVDQVISQSISAEDKLGEEKLMITVSKGKDPNLSIDLIDFSEMDENEIRQWFINNLFTDVNIEYEASIDVEDGKLIRLNVEGSAKRSEMIVITMSVGTESEGVEIIIPDFTSYTKANIEAWANKNNVDISYIYAYSDTIESGKVIMQDPKAETTIVTGSKATVTISKGKAVIIPTFAGNKESDITTWAKNNSIILKKTTVYSSLDKGLIVSTNPKAKTTVKVGSTIQYELSAGQVTIENYVSKTKASFTDYIQDLNYEYSKSAKIKIQYEEDSSDTVPAASIISMKFNNTVYDSSSDAEKTTDPNTTVTVTVSTGKTITVVSKTGSTEAAFKTYCSDLGLKTSKKKTEYSSIASGSIISNDTGKFSENDTISYILSKGAYSPDTGEYEGRSFASAQSILESYKNQGADSSWDLVRGDSVDSDNPGGSTVSCSVSSKTITCTISKGRPVDVEDFSGKSFNDFNSYLNTNGLLLGSKTEEYSNDIASGLIIRNDTSSKYAGEKVAYTLSLGEFTPNYGSYNNKTISEAQSALNSEVPSYLSGYSVVQNGEALYHDTVADKDIISCSYNNKTVSCTVSKGVEPETPTVFTLSELSFKEDKTNNNPDTTKTNIESYLSSIGASQFFEVRIVDGNGVTSGLLLDGYPGPGEYSMLSTDPKLIVEIAN